MISHLENSFDRAEKGLSKLDDYILNMEGMSGVKTRHFYNNVVDFPNKIEKLPNFDVRCLEIGTWKGSSTCSLLCGNRVDITSIDNSSQFGNVKEEFAENTRKYLELGQNQLRHYIEDCWKLQPYEELGKFNVYLYDGGHTQEDHYKSLTHFYPCLDDKFIFIVDDWNWQQVRDGTFKAISELNLMILWEKQIFTSTDNSTVMDKDGYWNGIWVAYLMKS